MELEDYLPPGDDMPPKFRTIPNASGVELTHQVNKTLSDSLKAICFLISYVAVFPLLSYFQIEF